MQFADHPPPHFHVRYGEQEAMVAIDPPRVVKGRLSPKTLGLVMEWAALHRAELLADWDLAQRGIPLRKIAPLE